jgi:hypothetical protein
MYLVRDYLHVRVIYPLKGSESVSPSGPKERIQWSDMRGMRAFTSWDNCHMEDSQHG